MTPQEATIQLSRMDMLVKLHSQMVDWDEKNGVLVRILAIDNELESTKLQEN